MIVCDNCPYRGRCENMGRCIQGKNAHISSETIRPPILDVNTTKGPAKTANPEPSSTFKKMAKKMAKKGK
jgi:hypothetical protein